MAKKKPKTKEALEDKLQAQFSITELFFLEVFEADGHLALEVAGDGFRILDPLQGDCRFEVILS